MSINVDFLIREARRTGVAHFQLDMTLPRRKFRAICKRINSAAGIYGLSVLPRYSDDKKVEKFMIYRDPGKKGEK